MPLEFQNFPDSLLKSVGLAEIAGNFSISANDPSKQRVLATAVGQDRVKSLNSVSVPVHPIPFHTV
jgi:hypothetical protein